MQREVMAHSSHRIRYSKPLAGQSMVQSTAKLCGGFFFLFLSLSSLHLWIHENPVWTCSESSRKCLHSDICLNAKWSCRMIMNTKWINNDMWIMNTIYSSSDKIVSFLACTCINYLPQAQPQPAGSLLAHHRHLLSPGRTAASLKKTRIRARVCSFLEPNRYLL